MKVWRRLSLPKLAKQASAASVSALLGLQLLSPLTSFASVSTPFSTYTNSRFHTSLGYPSTWEEKSGSLAGERTVIAFVDSKNPSTSASLVFTPIPADYSRLGSFGGKETLRQYLFPKGEGIEANLVNEYIKGDSYYLEYVVSAPDQPKRHVYTVFALRPQETVVGLTLQTNEEAYLTYKETLEAIVPTLDVNVDKIL